MTSEYPTVSSLKGALSLAPNQPFKAPDGSVRWRQPPAPPTDAWSWWPTLGAKGANAAEKPPPDTSGIP